MIRCMNRGQGTTSADEWVCTSWCEWQQMACADQCVHLIKPLGSP